MIIDLFNNSSGFSFYFSIGYYKGFSYSRNGPTLKLILGWVSIFIGYIDIEDSLLDISMDYQESEQNSIKLREEIQKLYQQNEDTLSSDRNFENRIKSLEIENESAYRKLKECQLKQIEVSGHRLPLDIKMEDELSYLRKEIEELSELYDEQVNENEQNISEIIDLLQDISDLESQIDDTYDDFDYNIDDEDSEECSSSSESI